MVKFILIFILVSFIDPDFIFECLEFIFGMILDAPSLWLEDIILHSIMKSNTDIDSIIASTISSMLIYPIYGLIFTRWLRSKL